MFNVVVINNKTGKRVIMNRSPLQHGEACAMLSKITRYPWRTEKVEKI
uniref:Phage protein n=1 Tax=Salmonella phage vB_SEnST11_KE23 TaxID=3161174 RepID=A0AAU8GEX9_9CAUD